MKLIFHVCSAVLLLIVFTVLCLFQDVAVGEITHRWFSWGFSGEGIYAGFNAFFSVLITALIFWPGCALMGKFRGKKSEVKSPQPAREILFASLWAALAIVVSSVHATMGFVPAMSEWVAITCFLSLAFGIAEVGVAFHRRVRG